MSADVLENNSESVTEGELKKAFHSLILYMGEQEMYDMNSRVQLPNGLYVDVEMHITDIGGNENEQI